ncbi:Flavin-nucleotide-binding protein [Arthrobacter sp. 9V]|uniref:pyridoxamine 5'-phosphate oxidase family protein n=1 Tax=Arthrobacter sp. 9V TaxID=2653132 RepID=UPI0012F19C93|nr:pyridoxamine 5'-phosphate oxidase family protein [Arthrobacter sp. 9V]VXC03586.1 Flavin-nucleotide-binding protein [Arthrobacter sp. 9V]
MTDSPETAGSPLGQDDSSLAFDECWDLLAAATIGRLGLVVDDHPEIFPVNYVLFQRQLVFRSSPGRKLWGAQASRPAVLEIDGYDAPTQEAWSVVARGDTELMTDPDEMAGVDALGLEPWQPGVKDNYIRLTPRALTGRRFKVNQPDLWKTRTNDPRRASFE